MTRTFAEEMIALPNVAELKRITQSLATLDLIICPEWEDRYYSYDSIWSPTEQMASMRNGCGDEWFLFFDSTGAAGLKGLAHESPAASIDGLSRRLADAVPGALKAFSTEPAFSWDHTTFCYWQLAEDPDWRTPAELASVDTGASELLGILVSGIEAYRQFAAEYYEQDFDVSTIRQVFDHTPISAELVATLNGEISIDDIREDLVQVGYPH